MVALQIERVVVTGGREFCDKTRIEADLRRLLPLGLRRVAQGGHGIDGQFGGAEWPEQPKSADALAWLATRSLRLEAATYRPNRDLDGSHRGAPLNRNVRMLDAEKPDIVLAYPEERSRGTWHCVAEAVRRGITCVVWCPWTGVPRPKAPGAMGVVRDGVRRYRVECPALFDRGGKRAIVCKLGHLEADALFDALDGPAG